MCVDYVKSLTSSLLSSDSAASLAQPLDVKTGKSECDHDPEWLARTCPSWRLSGNFPAHCLSARGGKSVTVKFLEHRQDGCCVSSTSHQKQKIQQSSADASKPHRIDGRDIDPDWHRKQWVASWLGCPGQVPVAPLCGIWR